MGIRFGRATCRRRFSRLGAVAALVALPALIGAAAQGSATAATKTQVSLGDSYVAGPLIAPQVSIACLRSRANYPHLEAARKGYALHDVSCSGATTDDMTGPQKGYDGSSVPPQLNALRPGTNVVTLGIGGNDIGFTSIIQNCIAYRPHGPTRSGAQTCKAYYTAGGTDQLRERINATRPKVDAVLQKIHADSPQAKVYVVGYPAILPEKGSCWPQMPLTYTDFTYLRGVEKYLNKMLSGAAGANRATYIDTYTPTIGHDACKLLPTRYIEPVVPTIDAAPVHPNRFGEAAMASIVARKIG